MGCDFLKIEKISDSQIRCTLNRNDLQSRELKISELAYGTEKAKVLFHDMIEQASNQFGFETDDLPLMIEAIPVSADCIILNITKVEDPEELDTRFSRFAPPDEDSISENCENESFDFDDIFPDSMDIRDEDTDLLSNILRNVDNFIPMKDTLKALSPKANEKTVSPALEEPGPAEELPPEPVSRLFSFSSYNEASIASTGIKGSYEGESSLYKDTRHGKYYLLLTGYGEDPADFLKVCNEVTEYGRKEPMTFSTIGYLNEHCELIIRNNALGILKEY